MAKSFFITNAEAQSMLNDLILGFDAGTAAVINIYDSTVPTDADTALGAQVLLAQCTMSATSFGAASDATGAARITAAAISDDSSANATGTATFFRVLTQDAGTTICQGTVGTATSDLILNTVAITSGSTVSITAFTIDLSEGPGS